MKKDRSKTRLVIKILLKEYGIFLLAMYSMVPLLLKIGGYVTWPWTAVIAAPAFFLLLSMGVIIYNAIMYFVDSYRMGISIWDRMIWLYEAKYGKDDDEQ